MGKMMGLGWVPQSETRPLRNEAPLNCVGLRSSLDYEVAWRAVKGQDERQKTAPLTALHATWDLAATSEKNMEGRHVGLDFYDLLIEAHPVLIADDWRQSEPRGKDGALAVEETIGLPRRAYASRRSGVSGYGGEVYATNAQLTDPGIRRDYRDSPVPHSSWSGPA